MLKITDELISGFLNDRQTLLDPFYKEAEKEDEEFSEVFGSGYPSYMRVQRPNESEKQKKYREEYYEKIGNPVKGFLGLIEKQIDKVFSSEDFRVLFSQKSKLPNKSDTAEYYFTKGYYNGRNLLKSFAESIKSDTLIKPNSVLAILPNEVTGAYAAPYYLVAKSENVLYFKANEFCLIKSELKSDLMMADETTIIREKGDIFYFFDTTSYCIVRHIGYYQDGSNKYDINKIDNSFRTHGSSFLPCKKIGRKIKQQTEDGHELRTSDLADSFVFLKESVMNHEDLIVEHNHHVSSQEWRVGMVECGECKGTGKVRDLKGGKARDCPTCNGAKRMPVHTGSGLDLMVIPMDIGSLGKSEKLPNEFGGFIARPEAGARIFSESFDKNIKLALRPFGLENSIITPYNQSGDAKDKDMQEGYAFMVAMSDHIEELLDFLVKSVIEMRYKNLPKATIEAEMLSITVPKKFNLTSAQSLYNRLKDAGTNNMPDSVKMKYVKQLVEKESGINSDDYLLVKAKEKLDPFPAYTFTQKVLARDTLSDLKYVLTVNIDAILIECIEETTGFLLLSYKEQKDLVYIKAQEYLDGASENLKKEFAVKSSTNIVTENTTV
jgi:hypothetical protein